MGKNEQGKSVRDQIIALKAIRDNLKSFTEKQSEIERINAEIERLKLHLGKTDKKIEVIKAKEKIAESENKDDLALLLHMQKYILRLTKHIDHLIEASQDENNPDRANMHYHRLASRIENISALAAEYDKKFRG